MKISELLDGIAKLDLVLPEFQREYVWTREQSKQLMVSLYKEYPTGSLLFWKTDSPPDIKNVDLTKDRIGMTQVILDGQQRLTTLYLLMRGDIPPYYREVDIEYDPRSLFFNLEEGEFQYYQQQRMDPRPEWVAVVDCFTKDDKINPLEIADTKTDDPLEKNRLGNLYYRNLTHLQQIRERDYPIQVVPSDADIDQAIDVFDRVNSLGTKLTDAELALAHMTGKWPEARRQMKAKMEDLQKRGFEFDLTFMVRALITVVEERALFETIHATPRDRLEIGWRRLTKILDYLVTILPKHASIHSSDDVNSTNVFVPAIGYLSRHDGRFDSDERLRRCIHWLYAASTWSRYTSQTDNRLDHDISIIKTRNDPWSHLIDAIIEQRGRIEVKVADFEGRFIQHPLYRMSYVIAKANDAVDWFNGSPLENPHGAYRIHSHHIFPTSLLYSEGGYDSDNHLHKKIVNEIANRAFLTGDSNVELGNAHPAEYLPRVEANYPGALEKQFVPTDPILWQLSRYEEFLRERRRLLANAINDRLRHLLVSPAEIEEEPPLKELIQQGESTVLEFKSSLRWDHRQGQANKALETAVAKSVAGFLNAEGGTLMIGVDDEGRMIGIEKDLQSLGRKDRDGFQQRVLQLLEQSLGVEHLPYVDLRFETVGGQTVCVITIDACPRPVYLRDGEHRAFYARIGNTTRPFDTQAAHEYINTHWEI